MFKKEKTLLELLQIAGIKNAEPLVTEAFSKLRNKDTSGIDPEAFAEDFIELVNDAIEMLEGNKKYKNLILILKQIPAIAADIKSSVASLTEATDREWVSLDAIARLNRRRQSQRIKTDPKGEEAVEVTLTEIENYIMALNSYFRKLSKAHNFDTKMLTDKLHQFFTEFLNETRKLGLDNNRAF